MYRFVINLVYLSANLLLAACSGDDSSSNCRIYALDANVARGG